MPALYSFVAKVVAQIINPIILLLSAAAFVVFLWGVFMFVFRASNDTTKLTESKLAIFWGLIGLVIIFGAYGIINVAMGAFDLGTIQDKLP